MTNINTGTEIKATFLPAAVDACALYRMYIPHLNIRNSKFVFRYGALDVREFHGQQVIILQRQFSDLNLQCIKKLKEHGLKVLYDLDDNIWALTAANPHKQYFDEQQEGFHRCASESSVLTVSTKGLASAVKMGFNLPHEIHVIPNAIDFDLFYPKPVVENNELVIIGWGGSNTHSADVKDVFEMIPKVLDRHSNLRMEIVGAQAQDRFVEYDTIHKDGRPHYRKRETTKVSKIAAHAQSYFRPWVPVGEYANHLASWDWDIFVAPLEETRFNRSKSCIRMLEAAALKKPCLASDVQPYHEFCYLGGDDTKWLLCNSTNEWEEKLEILVNEPERRKYLGEKMYDVAYRFFNAATIAENWKYVFKQAMN